MTSAQISEWAAAYEDARKTQEMLVLADRWSTGRRTIAEVIGRHRAEAFHSTVLAWLLDPSEGHGLGERVLRRFLAAVDARDVIDGPLPTLRTEVASLDPRSGAYGRNDIVIAADSGRVIVEVKVDAPETGDQLDRYAAACDTQRDRLVYLTRGGGRPSPACTSAASWHCLSWEKVHELVAEAVVDLAPQVAAPAVLDYLTTLKELLAMASPDEVVDLDEPLRFFLKRRKQLEQWIDIGKDEPAAVDRLMRRLAASLSEAVPADRHLITKILADGTDAAGWRRGTWPVADGADGILVTLWWTQKSRFEGAPDAGPGVGLYLPASLPDQHRRQITDGLAANPPDGYTFAPNDPHWPLWMPVPATGRFWDDLAIYRADLSSVLEHTWDICAPLVDNLSERSVSP